MIKQKKIRLFSLLMRTLKDVMRIAPKEAVLRCAIDLGNSVSAGLNTYLLAKFITALSSYSEAKHEMYNIIFYLICITALFIINSIASGIAVNSRIKAESTIMYKLNIELSEKCYKIPLIRYEDANFQNSLNRARKCVQETYLSEISLSVLNIASEIFRVASIMIVLASFNILLVPISVMSILPFLFMRIIRGKKFYDMRWFQAKKEMQKNYLYGLFNNKNSMKEIRVFGIGDYLQKKWETVKNELNEETWAFKKKDIISFTGCDILKISGYIGSITFVLYLVLTGYITVGMMSAAIIAFSEFQSETRYFFINIGRIPQEVAFTNDFYSFMEQTEEAYGNEPFNSNNNGITDITANNVSFTYPNTTKPALNNLSIQIRKGETAVILGENGSGKTTLAMLLLGLYKCDDGEILYGSQNINDIDLNSLFDNISVVSQQFNKYSLTLRENIAVGDISRIGDDEQMVQILHKLKLDTLLSEKGLDNMMGTEFGGKELSTGQWQKIAIARSLFKNCAITILDEPTAALDPLIESEILKEFISLSKDKTAVIISHRVGLCRDADKIIVMKDGNAVECGTHQELIKNNGEYNRLYSAQSKWYS